MSLAADPDGHGPTRVGGAAGLHDPRFFHTAHAGARRRRHRDAGRPQGKRVGVPEYQQTAAIWGRGVLRARIRRRPRDIEWFMERTPSAAMAARPASSRRPGVTVHPIPPTRISARCWSGRTRRDAALFTAPQPGRPQPRRSRRRTASAAVSRSRRRGRRYYAKTGIYPINHGVVVRRSLVEKHPWIALNLYKAFVGARAEVLRAGGATLASHLETG